MLAWPRRDHGIAAIAAGYSNMVMLGFPLVLTAFGDAAALPLFILLALQSLLVFPATTWMLEVYGGGHGTDSLSSEKRSTNRSAGSARLSRRRAASPIDPNTL